MKTKDNLLTNSIILLLYIFIFECCNWSSSSKLTCDQISIQYSSLLKKSESREYSYEIIDRINTLLRKRKDCLNAYVLLGDINIGLGEFDQAEKNYEHVLTIDSNHIYSIFKLGTLFVRKKTYDSALYYFDKAEKIKTISGFALDFNDEFDQLSGQNIPNVKYSKIIFNRAIASYHFGDLLNSMYDLNYCIKHRIQLDESYFYRGLIYLKIEDHERACADFHSAKVYGNSYANEYLLENKCARGNLLDSISKTNR